MGSQVAFHRRALNFADEATEESSGRVHLISLIMVRVQYTERVGGSYVHH